MNNHPLKEEMLEKTTEDPRLAGHMTMWGSEEAPYAVTNANIIFLVSINMSIKFRNSILNHTNFVCRNVCALKFTSIFQSKKNNNNTLREN